MKCNDPFPVECDVTGAPVFSILRYNSPILRDNIQRLDIAG